MGYRRCLSHKLHFDLLKLAPLCEYVILSLSLTYSSCYTLKGSKSHILPIPATSNGWQNIFPYPYHAYRPSIPLHNYRRYPAEAYFTPSNLQNSDYYLDHELLSSYFPSFDDSDYYFTYVYYIPARGRVTPYHDQNMLSPTVEIQDYKSTPAEDDGISNKEREWWFHKNVPLSGGIDFDQVGRFDDIFGKSKVNSKNNRRKANKTRYAGFDGFVRKTGAKNEERTWVYGVPIDGQHEDRDVRELKSLLKAPMSRRDEKTFIGSDLADWDFEDAKRSIDSFSHDLVKGHNKEMNGKVGSTIPTPGSRLMPIYNEGGFDYVASRTIHQNDTWRDEPPKRTSVFDTIKELLALEDNVKGTNEELQLHKMLNQKSPITKRSAIRGTKVKPMHRRHSTTTTSTEKSVSTRTTPPIESTSRMSIKVHKRSTTANKMKQFYTDEGSLRGQLNALSYHTKI